MFLFEAIRLGAMLAPQGWGSPRDPMTACAMDAALLAVGETDTVRVYTKQLVEQRKRVFPFAYASSVPPCPVCGVLHPRIADLIAACLNDRHQWTREAIAQWLEPIERSFAAQHPEAYAASLPEFAPQSGAREASSAPPVSLQAEQAEVQR